jgi:hypothetical protein
MPEYNWRWWRELKLMVEGVLCVDLRGIRF